MPRLPSKRSIISRRFIVTPPFGADHVVAVVTGRAPPELRGRLQDLHGTAAPTEAIRAVLELGLEGRIGIQGLFTGPRL